MDITEHTKQVARLYQRKDDEHFRKACLLPALDASLIEMTNPDKAKSSKQKYRLTERGEQIVNGGGL